MSASLPSGAVRHLNAVEARAPDPAVDLRPFRGMLNAVVVGCVAWLLIVAAVAGLI